MDTIRYRQERERIEKELDSIATISPEAARILTTEGFLAYFVSMREIYPSYLDAYECLEGYYLKITGSRRYSEYAVMCRALSRFRGRK